ncbi:hypothetical protein [Methylobacterium sp. SyP6R]|uniref:hypothetical protein n=1 Tax=Methylobacterium sp. SyP6R TaxID=2718876 RepID=UPI001F43F905|nr:hypothetical protein [Methylobacterium sp. SyP6R]MCF4130260.1 hypothetical protein [Methylobacterium sp. SyP6R]
MTRGTMTHAGIPGPSRRTALAGGLAVALGGAGAAMILPAPAAAPSPVLAAIAAHREAEAAIAAAVLAHAKAQERDAPEAPALRADADAACDRGAAVLSALCAMTPCTVEEAGAMADHFATISDASGAEGMAVRLLEALAVALGARAPTGEDA